MGKCCLTCREHRATCPILAQIALRCKPLPQASSLYAPTVSEATREPRGTRLHDRGLIAHPVNKAKYVVFTDAGVRESERLFKLYFVDGYRRPDR
ncbi:DUF6429 family protein [Paraburkholderia tropica]|uniref:DUF6429 family protein n=1 Tax=Paraburkholderia tropica TaxID=92647 RepID=UPI000945550F